MGPLFAAYLTFFYIFLALDLYLFRHGIYARDLHDPRRAALLAVPVVLMFGLPWIGWRYLRERTRTRARLAPLATPPVAGDGGLRVELPQLRLQLLARQAKVRIGVFIGWILLCGVLAGAYFASIQATPPDRIAPMREMLGGLLAANTAIFLLVPALVTAIDRRALAVTRGKRQLFEIGEQTMRIPLLLLTNPALFRAAASRLDHLEVPFSAITSWRVEPAVGKALAQHALTFDFESDIAKRYGYSFGFKRDPLRPEEKMLLAEARRRLKVKIDIDDDL